MNSIRETNHGINDKRKWTESWVNLRGKGYATCLAIGWSDQEVVDGGKLQCFGSLLVEFYKSGKTAHVLFLQHKTFFDTIAQLSTQEVENSCFSYQMFFLLFLVP